MHSRLLTLFVVAFSWPASACLSAEPANAKQAASAKESASAKQVEELLVRQRKNWNAGRIDRFMADYWNSERLTFSSGGKTTRGWQATRDRYHKRYPDRETMGTLRFSKIEVTDLGGGALAIGRWELQRKAGNVGGNFSIVLKRFGKQLKIIHDHTSVDEGK